MTASRRILVADDSPNDRELIARAFRKLGLEGRVDLVEDGQACLNHLLHSHRSNTLPALLLLDVNMPEVGGFEVLHTIRANPALRDLPVVMFSTSAQAADVARAYQLGTNAYVVKPPAFAPFLEAVERLAAFWGCTNEPPLFA